MRMRFKKFRLTLEHTCNDKEADSSPAAYDCYCLQISIERIGIEVEEQVC